MVEQLQQQKQAKGQHMTQNTSYTRSILALIALALLAALPAASHAQCARQQAKLLASDGATGDEFGFSVSISGNVAIVGSQGDDDNGADSGSAYIFAFDGTTWVLQRKLVPVDGAAGDLFGESVSISGDVAIVGAPLDDDNGDRSGSAYIYRFDGTTWSQEQKLLASDGAERDFFGISVSISGDVAVVGALDDDDNGTDSGSAYVFRFDGTTWTHEQKLLASDGAAEDFFGDSVSISGDVAIVGADGNDDNGPESGSAYMFTGVAGCLADLTGDCQTDVLDFFVFGGLFGTDDPRADLDGDGSVNVLDFFVFVAAFAAGCP